MRSTKKRGRMKLIDISYPYWDGMAIYLGNPSFSIQKISEIESGDACRISQISMGTHTGTHIDAPAHFIKDGKTIDQIPLEDINGPAILIEAMGRTIIDVEFIKNQDLNNCSIVLFKTDNTKRYAGRNIIDSYTTLTYDAAEYLAGKKIKLIGIDYMTIERPRSMREVGKSIHRILLENGVCILEALKLEDVEEGVYQLHCYPLNLLGADGSPIRAILELNEF